MTGRPEKLTPALQAEICKLLAGGISPEAVADYVGISRRTYFRWLSRGKSSKRGPYFQFLVAVRQAIARAEAADVLLIGKAAQKDWHAAAFRLARRFPKRWGRGREQTQPAPEQLTPTEMARRLCEFMAAAEAAVPHSPAAPPARDQGLVDDAGTPPPEIT